MLAMNLKQCLFHRILMCLYYNVSTRGGHKNLYYKNEIIDGGFIPTNCQPWVFPWLAVNVIKCFRNPKFRLILIMYYGIFNLIYYWSSPLISPLLFRIKHGWNVAFNLNSEPENSAKLIYNCQVHFESDYSFCRIFRLRV